MAKMKLGKATSRSGASKIVERRGASAGKTPASVAKPLPPAPKAGHGLKIIESKSGRPIIASPAKSANSIASWSTAFKDT